MTTHSLDVTLSTHTDESLLTQLENRPNILQVWWGIIRGVTNSWKELAAAQALIHRLEAGELAEEMAARRALKKIEQAIIKAGDTKKSAKTIRHELLAVLDREYHKGSVE